MAQAVQTPYPVQFDVDYPERQSRWKALFRLVLALPALLFAAFVLYALFLAIIVMWLAILIRGRIPRWLFDFHVGVARFNVRVQAYMSLLTDVYPAWDGDYPVKYEVAYPERVSRRKVVVWKFATALPQWIAVTVLQYASFAIVAIGWLVILLTGKFPKGLHTFVVGTMRWRERVYAYSLSLTDEYPPYSMSAEAPAASGSVLIASSVLGGAVIAVLIAGITAVALTIDFGGEEYIRQVSYERLQEGDVAFIDRYARINAVDVELLSALDPADGALRIVTPYPGYRMVQFSFYLVNNDIQRHFINSGDFELATAREDGLYPVLVIAGRRAAPILLGEGERAEVEVVFEVPLGVDPDELSYGGGVLSDIVVYEFR